MDYLSSFSCNTYAIVNMVKRRYGPGRNQSSRRGPLIVCGVRESLIHKAVQMGVLKVYTMYIVACADPEWGNVGPDPTHGKLRMHPARIQCQASIGTPVKRHLNGVALLSRYTCSGPPLFTGYAL